MIFVSILVVASVLAALVQRRAHGASIDFREVGRVGLIFALATSGVSLLATGGWQTFVAHCTSLDCLIAPESDPVFRLLGAALLIPRSLVPLSAAIVCLEFGWRILSGAETSLMPGEALPAGGWPLRAADIFVVMWSAFIADLPGRLQRRIRAMPGKASGRDEELSAKGTFGMENTSAPPSSTRSGTPTGILSVYNEWDSIAEIIVGDGQSVYFPGHHPIEDEAQHSRLRRLRNRITYGLFQGFKVPDWMTRPLREELNGLTQELVRRNITVLHPSPVRPEHDEPAGIGQMFARDPIMTVGSTLVVGALQIEMRRKELRGLEPILQSLADRGAKIARLTEPGAYLEGGDVILDWPNVYVGIGKYGSNMAGARWLQGTLGDEALVIPVPLAVPGILHLDCCMTLIGPKLGIICREALIAPLPKPLDEYDFIEIDEQTRREMGGNVLVLDAKTIALQKRHTKLAALLTARGYTVIPLQFTSHANLDGAFRCATAPLRRIAAGRAERFVTGSS